jgi:hypothetical protein
VSDGSAHSLLVSFCNIATSPRASSLLRLNVPGGGAEWVDLGFGGEPMVSGVGICSDDTCIYHLSIAQQGFETRLTVLDRHTLEVLHAQTLAEIADGHSIRRVGDDLVVASTGMDDVVAYRLDGHRAVTPRLMWSPTGANNDTHHINSVEVVGNELVCTAFGAKADASWASATQGYLFNITSATMVAEGLQQPHSARFFDGRLFFCNSRRGTVETTAGVVAQLDGYSRGLDFGPDGAMVAATSVSRRSAAQGPATGAFLNPGDTAPAPGAPQGLSTIVEIPARDAPRAPIAMAEYGAEIYDLFFV